MTWLRVLVLRLLALFRKGRLDQRKGMSPREARYAALRSFGGVEQVKEVYREQRGLPMIETLIQDLRYGLRMMLKNRGFSVTALVSLSLGIGCTVTVFTFVDAVLIRKLPVRSPEQLVAIGAPGKNLNLNPSYFSHALPTFA